MIIFTKEMIQMEQKAKTIEVKFIKGFGDNRGAFKYTPGEHQFFQEDYAKEMIKQGYCEKVIDFSDGISQREYDLLVENIGKEKTDLFMKSQYKQKDTLQSKEELLENLRESYNDIISILKKYCDLEEEHYNIIALWIIGTYFHKKFTTFPYLFFNAMKGSGKSRLLKLISYLCNEGDLLTNLSESVIFRSASTSTFCIDEFESIEGHTKGILRELLNAAYKKGMCVKRARKNHDGEWEIDKFELYCPIAMANITGMDNVLGDRCIPLILEKSSKKDITRLIESFEKEEIITKIKGSMQLVHAYPLEEVYPMWNTYISTYSLTTLTTYNIPPFFEKIEKSGIDGRNLELFMPLLTISQLISDEIFDKTLKTAILVVNQRKEEDSMENRDHSFLEFIATSLFDEGLISITKLTNDFRAFLNEDTESMASINNKWIGRALKRHNLRVDHVHRTSGIFVRVNVDKARSKSFIFKKDAKQIQIP